MQVKKLYILLQREINYLENTKGIMYSKVNVYEVVRICYSKYKKSIKSITNLVECLLYKYKNSHTQMSEKQAKTNCIFHKFYSSITSRNITFRIGK